MLCCFHLTQKINSRTAFVLLEDTFIVYLHVLGGRKMVCGSAVGWGTVLQPEGRGFISHRGIYKFYNSPNSSGRTMVLGLTQRLTEI
jgi:hypothetical protein